MKQMLFGLFMTLASTSAFGADQISVTINGQSYNCSGAPAVSEPTAVSMYCECSGSGILYFRRLAVMSNGTEKVLSSEQMTPIGSSNPAETQKKCDAKVRQCR